MIYEIKSHITPSLFTSSIDGQKYIVPQWIPVPKDTKFEDIRHIKIEYDKFQDIAKVKASKGNTFYTLSKKGNEYKCTCSGFKFKRTCKHLAEYIIKEKVLK